MFINKDHKDSRGQGLKGSSDLLKNYKELKVWNRIVKKALEPLNPRILESFVSTNLEKHHKSIIKQRSYYEKP